MQYYYFQARVVIRHKLMVFLIKSLNTVANISSIKTTRKELVGPSHGLQDSWVAPVLLTTGTLESWRGTNGSVAKMHHSTWGVLENLLVPSPLCS